MCDHQKSSSASSVMREMVTITKNIQLNESFYHLSFRSSDIAPCIQCGQFVFIKITDTLMPLLRRPFSVAWVHAGEVNIVYKVIGEGTTLLTQRKPGEKLDVMGPIGKGFSATTDRVPVLVAGGVGIASLISLTKMCVHHGSRLIYGARTKDECIDESFLQIASDKVLYATDDGTKGHKGLVTDVLKQYLEKTKEKPYLYVCGPLPMIQAVVRVAAEYGVQGEANLEERMACGVGACLGCAVETPRGMRIVCKEGPVFTFEELGWK